jgi:hypothetical protein
MSVDQHQDGAMADTQNRSNLPQVRPAPMLTGAGLVGAGGLIALVGLGIGGFHLLSAIQQWVREMEVPPSQLAMMKLRQAKVAAAAGASAWQNGSTLAD